MHRLSILLLVLLSCVKQTPAPQPHIASPLEQFLGYRRSPGLQNCHCTPQGSVWAQLELEQRSAVTDLIEAAGNRWGRIAAVQCAADFGFDLPENDAAAKSIIRGTFAEISFPGTRLQPVKMVFAGGIWRLDYASGVFAPDVEESVVMEVEMRIWIAIRRQTAADVAAGRFASLKEVEAFIASEDDRQTS